MKSGYQAGLTIDRIDNSKGYSPENCRWADHTTQNRNRRNVHMIGGETLKDISERSGLSYSTLYWRLKHGKSFEDALCVSKSKGGGKK